MMRFVVALALCCCTMLCAEHLLARHGQAEYVFVVAEDCDSELLEAVADMSRIFHKSSGASFKTVRSAKADEYDKRIFIGRSAVRKALGEIREPENEERIYKSVGEDIVIYGGGRCGDVFAIYQFLMDTIGFRALHFWGDTIIPQHLKLVVPTLDYDRVPSYIHRDILQGTWNLLGCPTSVEAFRRMMMHSNQFSAVKILTGCHTFSCFIPRGYPVAQRGNPYAPFKDKAYFKTNPDFFGMNAKGQRVDSMQLCFSNTELRKTLTENIETFVRFRKMTPQDAFIVDVAQDDIGGYFCRCEGCKSFEKQYGAPAGAFYDYLVKEASPYFAEHYPRMMIRFLTYGGKTQTEQPPVASALPEGRLPANLLPYLAYIQGDFARPWDCEANRGIHDSIVGWGKLAKNMFLYYYPTTYARPMVSIHLGGNVLRTVKDYVEAATKLNIHYLLNDYSLDFFVVNAGFTGLHHYLIARLSNDASLNVHELIREYTDAIYGPAGRCMRAYFYELEQLCADDPAPHYWMIDCRFPNYVRPQNLVRWQKNYDAMERLLEKYPPELKHLKASRLNLDQLTMLMWNEIKQEGLADGMELNKIYARYAETAREALERVHNVKTKNYVLPADRKEAFARLEEAIIGQGRAFYQIGGGGNEKLPPNLSAIPEKRLRFVMPYANKLPISFFEDAVYGVALDGKCGKEGTVDYRVVDGSRKYPNVSAKVQIANGGPYAVHYIGRTKLTRWTEITAPCMPRYSHRFRGGLAGYAKAYVGYLYDESSPDQEWDVHVSCRFDKEKVFTERFILVKVEGEESEKGAEKPKAVVVPSGKGGSASSGRIVLHSKYSKHKHETADGFAQMDGNHGWEIQMYLPSDLDWSKKYTISVELRASAGRLPKELTTRIGTYDTKDMRITGYLPFSVNSIKGEEFKLKTIPRPVTLTPDTYIYIGGFQPVNEHEGTIIVKSFIIEPAVEKKK